MTPIVKAYCSDKGNRVVENAMQVYGGYGYSAEYPVEQHLRDVKIATIFEGTNGVQAMDLLGRKITANKGVALKAFLDMIDELIDSGKGDSLLGAEMLLLEKAKERVLEAATYLSGLMGTNVKLALLKATPFLDLFGDTVLGWQVLWQAKEAKAKLAALGFAGNMKSADAFAEGNGEAAFYIGKVAMAKFFANNYLTAVPGKVDTIFNCDESALEIPDSSFAAVR
jgi:hypothetical protein